MPVQLNATTGGGNVTITAPSSVTGTKTLTVPGVNGNIITSADSGTVTGSMLAAATVAQSNLATNIAGNGPAFRAYASAATSMPNSTFQKIALNTAPIDTSTSFNTTLNRFVVPVAGYYFVTGQIAHGGATSGWAQLNLYKNGASYSSGSSTLNNTNVGAQIVISDIILCAVGDYLELWGWQNSGASLNTQVSAGYNYLSGILIRSA